MDGSRWKVVGRGAVILGILNVVRLIAEGVVVMVIRRDANVVLYGLLIGADILLSGVSIAGGWVLIRGHDWAPTWALFSAGAWFSSSLGLFIWMWPYILGALQRISGLAGDVILVPRLLFYALMIIASPLGAIALLLKREPEGPSRTVLIGSLIGGLTAGGVYVLLLLIGRH